MAIAALYLGSRSASLDDFDSYSFALALADRLSVPVRRARTGVELVVLASGWALGGTVGLGTLAFAIAIGPMMQSGLRLTNGLRQVYGRLDRGASRFTADGPLA